MFDGFSRVTAFHPHFIPFSTSTRASCLFDAQGVYSSFVLGFLRVQDFFRVNFPPNTVFRIKHGGRIIQRIRMSDGRFLGESPRAIGRQVLLVRDAIRFQGHDVVRIVPAVAFDDVVIVVVVVVRHPPRTVLGLQQRRLMVVGDGTNLHVFGETPRAVAIVVLRDRVGMTELLVFFHRQGFGRLAKYSPNAGTINPEPVRNGAEGHSNSTNRNDSDLHPFSLLLQLSLRFYLSLGPLTISHSFERFW